MIHDAGVEISADIIPEVNRHPAVTAAAVEAGSRLGRRLKAGHDRMAVAGNMQEKMMVMVDAIA
ncbi:hypothetical protein DSCA_29690 [Desulfosarcina alkanivorans]|uniref:Uncharacterized protein n=2 Tax=Desulfosarcina alkanivorans TaxID=571177 RepID=A0A5K7YME8_9BACT|nr:hypothetical protein DSCA_29690 [Desulfosarcina alkanivorans]